MNNSQEEVELVRDVIATLIPHGEEFTLGRGEKVTITHRLGGNFTVMTLQGMYRIAAKDADALGESTADKVSAQETKNDLPPANIEQIKENLKSVFDPEIPVNVVDLGLIYRVEIEKTEDRGRIVFVDLTLTAPGCGMGPVIADDVKNKVLELPGIDDAEVDIVWDPPWSQDLISEEGKMELGLV
ncbi:MAG: putative Fe-S cluster assembly protein SufT [Opitutales bacterium]|nr:putative Fe-S cluster assembly protein SufT [Opitutales bacterium]